MAAFACVLTFEVSLGILLPPLLPRPPPPPNTQRYHFLLYALSDMPLHFSDYPG